MDDQKICRICSKASVLKCSACEDVYYCGKRHQKKDWDEHSKLCKPFKVARNELLGRHYVATRNIKAGEIVLRDEKPMVDGPMNNCMPVCLRCYTVLKKSIATPCEKCGWPLCGKCNEHGLECEFTTSRRETKVSITEFDYPHPSYRCISVIRALSLKTIRPELYEKFLSLESHSNLVNNEGGFTFERPLDVVSFVKRFFKTDDITDEEIKKVIGIIQVNGHEVPLTEPAYVAVYEQASLLEHSCRANCSKSFTDSGGLVVHAAVPITKGEHVSICYTDPLWGTANRRHHLWTTKFFECVCERCRDPTEFGTMFNGLKCDRTKYCQGCMLPASFLGLEPSDYACDVCLSTKPIEEVEGTLMDIGLHLSDMRKHDVVVCRHFLHHYKDVLHENHYYNVDVTVALSQLIGQQAGGLATVEESFLSEKIDLCKKLDCLLRTLVPAENRVRGLILFELHAALAEVSRRHPEADNINTLLESKRALADAYQLLKYEPRCLPEGKIAYQAERNLREMNSLLKRLMAE
ncbi:SET domain-containing protein SmydA-8-like isoform X2 [Ceratina calcarata]|uniref:SET domain-containing protein SmydA-8-like isoform X2 n=1 Tax=Ceratina calcarata TaxID=156304 RepID=A0AAJ7NAH0_9HYME|nr:SET domain-containing protein SmydA-8-like isoform X2 [Ceratina calcarata]